MTVEFRANVDGPGITVVDRIEGRRFPLSTSAPVALDAGPSDRFLDPVDAAVSCRLDGIALPHVVGIFVRTVEGEMLTSWHEFANDALPAGEYELEIAAPVKLFVRVSGPVSVTSTTADMELSFPAETAVDVGARSYHERPAATVTTTAEPEDLMAAVSTFGSALKTTSPERSFSSLRGHPPAIELGDELAVPASVTPPETGLRIEVPRDRSAVYAVATLAHYLGATVSPGRSAALFADDELVHSLEGDDDLFGGVTGLLGHVFLLDCVVRTEGRYRIDLYERQLLDSRLDLPLADLYETPIAERVRRYLDVPLDALSDLVPTWSLSSQLSPVPASAELLPYAANALSLIRVGDPGRAAPSAAPPPGYRAFRRAGRPEPSVSGSEPPAPHPERSPVDVSEAASAASEASATSARAAAPEALASIELPADAPSYVRLPATDALERAWVGPERPVNANHVQLAGVRNRLEREAPDGAIDVAIVCNDARMAAEFEDGRLYGDRADLPFDVAVHRDLSRSALRTLLSTDLDFLHYVGHVERGGFVCRDGTLDPVEVEDVGVDTFFLNGCRSYDPGRALIDGGSVAGIVTHGAVDDANATAIGKLVAGLLNTGFTLRSALSVVSHHHTVEGQYAVVGDGAVQIAQSEGGTPTYFEMTRAPDDATYTLRITTYPTLGPGMGACYTPHIPSVDRYFLVGGTLPPMQLSLPELSNLLSLERVPVRVDGELRWSNELSPAELP